jgi:4-amino-4-deoxy-L-arabinose transferase-like glycosyltransferase
MSRRVVLALALLAAVAFTIRLGMGIWLPLDGDEATVGVSALRVLHGHVALLESAAHYLGAIDSYILAPGVWLLGPSLIAVRATFSAIGALYVVVMFFLGRRVLGSDRRALLVSLIATVFPLFTMTYGTKARDYSSMLVLIGLCLITAFRLSQSPTLPRAREWTLAGLVWGVSIWTHPLLAITVVVCIVAVAAQVGRWGWAPTRRPAAIGLAAALVGYSPWVIYNAEHRLSTLRHLYGPLQTHHVATVQAAKDVLTAALPIFVGMRVNYCGEPIVPAAIPDLALLGLAAFVAWLRRSSLRNLVRGNFAQLEPVDFVLILGTLAVLAVTAPLFNSTSCEPRYLMPLAVPLVVAMALAIARSGRKRSIWIGGLVAWVGLSGVTAVRSAAELHDVVSVQSANQRADIETAATALQAAHPPAVWSYWSLARALQFASGDRLAAGAYGGYVSFTDVQTTALTADRPWWIFLSQDPGVGKFEAYCARHGISYTRTIPATGLVLYANPTARIRPSDLGLATQPVTNAD